MTPSDRTGVSSEVVFAHGRKTLVNSVVYRPRLARGRGGCSWSCFGLAAAAEELEPWVFVELATLFDDDLCVAYAKVNLALVCRALRRREHESVTLLHGPMVRAGAIPRAHTWIRRLLRRPRHRGVALAEGPSRAGASGCRQGKHRSVAGSGASSNRFWLLCECRARRTALLMHDLPACVAGTVRADVPFLPVSGAAARNRGRTGAVPAHSSPVPALRRARVPYACCEGVDGRGLRRLRRERPASV